MTMLLSSLSIFPATPEQVIESWRKTSKEWGRGMSEDEYLEREVLAHQGEFSREGRLITWVLAPRVTPETLVFLCSCETYRRDSLAFLPPDGTTVSQLKEVTSYGIASVFTPLSNRRKGYARHMMRLLHWVLAPESSLPPKFPEEWGTPPVRLATVGDACFSALWSDVGKEFYRACGPTPGRDGWVTRNPVSTVWDVQEYTQSFQKEENATSGRQWSWLGDDEVVEMWKLDAKQIKDDMLASQASTSLLPRFTFLPHQGVGEFQHRRLKFFWEKINPLPGFWGVYSTPPGIENDSCLQSCSLADGAVFATWTIEFRPPSGPQALIITRLRVKPDHFEELLNFIIEHAKKHGLKTVEVWNIPEELKEIAVQTEGHTFERDEHLPSFKWYGSEDSRAVEWMLNEKFCWC